MPAPLLFGIPAAGAVASLGPRLVAEAIERGGDINDEKSVAARTVEANVDAARMMDEMRRTAHAIQLMKKQK